MTSYIISLNFNPGHISHLIASYKQFEELGYESYYLVDERFRPYLPKDSRILNPSISFPAPTIAIFTFPSQNNLKYLWWMKHKGTKICYIFHEPLAPMRIYKKAGFSWRYLARLWVVDFISALTVKKSDAVLLPSRKAIDYYEKNPRYKNKHYHYLPLMYDDERGKSYTAIQRVYFSYIGTIAADHSFNEYVSFVEWAIINNALPDLKFLIATKSEFYPGPILGESERVTIHQGRPLTNEEINSCYLSSVVVWNAYDRTTQSGVLAKSFMFGTPVIVLKKNVSEFMIPGKEVEVIDDNRSVEQIEEAVARIISQFEPYSTACRERFIKTFYYRNHNSQFKEILRSI